jgi:hypothetical protein
MAEKPAEGMTRSTGCPTLSYHLMACIRRATSSTFARELNALMRK